MYTKGSLLSKMLHLAVNSHHNQFDKSGMPYILHPIAVMQMVGNDEELQCIALAHDLVEDCDVTLEQLSAEFTPRIVEAVGCLTKIPGESFDEYKARVKSNPDAVLVKIADLRHNSDITRLKGVTDKDIKRMAEYHTLYVELVNML